MNTALIDLSGLSRAQKLAAEQEFVASEILAERQRLATLLVAITTILEYDQPPATVSDQTMRVIAELFMEHGDLHKARAAAQSMLKQTKQKLAQITQTISFRSEVKSRVVSLLASGAKELVRIVENGESVDKRMAPAVGHALELLGYTHELVRTGLNDNSEYTNCSEFVLAKSDYPTQIVMTHLYDLGSSSSRYTCKIESRTS